MTLLLLLFQLKYLYLRKKRGGGKEPTVWTVASSLSGHQRLTEVLAKNLQSKRGEAHLLLNAKTPQNKTTTTKLCVLNIILCVLILSLFHGTAGDVSRGAGGDSGRHRTHTVRQDPGAAFQTDLQMCLQPTFPGQRWLIVTMPTFPVGWGWPNSWGTFVLKQLLVIKEWRVVIGGMKTWLS